MSVTRIWRPLGPGRIAAGARASQPPTAAPTMRDIRAAAERIRDHVIRSPVESLVAIDPRLRVKLELLQPTGSFKVRGAANRMLTLTEDELAGGVITASSGNHGIAVAHLSGELGIRAVICVPRGTDSAKLSALRRSGAEVHADTPDYDSSVVLARDIARRRGLRFIHAFDDPRVIEGHATIGLELSEQTPNMATVLIPLSGGGLASGVAAALRAISPRTRVVGVSAANAPVMYRSLLTGGPTVTPEAPTLAGALSGGLGDDNRHSFALTSALLDEVWLVAEREIAAAMLWGERRLGVTVEGAAAAALAALLFPATRATSDGTIVALATGGNLDESTRDRARALAAS